MHGIGDDARVRHGLGRIFAIGLIIVTGLFCVMPVYYLFEPTFSDGGDGIQQMIDDPAFGDVIRSTLQLAVGSVVFALVLGTALAWFAHSLPPRRKWLGMLPLFPLIVPQLALVLGFSFLLSPTIGFLNQVLRLLPFVGEGGTGPFDVYTLPWMITITGLSMSAFVYLFVRSSLANLHQDLIDAAGAAGAGPLRAFWGIVIPIIRPAMVYGALTVTLLGLGQFTVPLLLGRQLGVNVLTTEMYYHLSSGAPNKALVSAYGLPILISGLAFLVVQRVILGDQGRYITTAGKGSRPMREGGKLPQLVLGAYALFTVVLPMTALVIVALQPFWSKDVVVSDFTLENVRTVLTEDNLTEAIRNSLWYGIQAVAIVLPLGYLCARIVYRRRYRPVLASVQEVIVSLPLGIPTVILGAGFLLAYLNSPLDLYATGFGVVLVYVVIMLPFATRLILVSMLNLGEDLSNAAASAGAGPLRRIRTVELPLLRPALGGAAALVVVLSTHEFSASILVRSQDTQVMGTVLYDLWSFGSYPQAASMALVMCVVTAAGVALAVLVGGGGAFNLGNGADRG